MALTVNFTAEEIQRLQEAIEGSFNASSRFPSGGIMFPTQFGNIRPGIVPVEDEPVIGFGRRIGNAFSTPASTAEIHADLDARSGEVVREAERILEYRYLYPSNAFLTRNHVRDLCRKYSLAFAPLLCFAGEIPDRNRQEMEHFRPHPRHVMQGRLKDVRWQIRPQTNVVFDAPDDYRAPLMVPVSPGLGLFVPGGLEDLIENTYAYKPYGGGMEGKPMLPIAHLECGTWARLEPRCFRILDLEINRETRFGVRQIMMELQCHSIIMLGAERMVICPPAMLLEGLNGRLEAGWEYHISPTPLGAQPFGNDPIVLEPVEGGFLVVSKWDAEANLPEVAGQTN